MGIGFQTFSTTESVAIDCVKDREPIQKGLTNTPNFTHRQYLPADGKNWRFSHKVFDSRVSYPTAGNLTPLQNVGSPLADIWVYTGESACLECKVVHFERCKCKYQPLTLLHSERPKLYTISLSECKRVKWKYNY